MNGPDHYRRAGELLRAAETGEKPPLYPGTATFDAMLSPSTLVAAAAVHAQLAKTAAYVEVIGLPQTDQLGPLPVLPMCVSNDCIEIGPHIHQGGMTTHLPEGTQFIRFQGNAWWEALHGPVAPDGEPVPESEVRR